MTVREELAAALTLTEQAIAALESGDDAAEDWVARALSACEAAASLPVETLTNPEEAASVCALAERAGRLAGALGTASRRLAKELERLRASRHAAGYGTSAPGAGGVREA